LNIKYNEFLVILINYKVYQTIIICIRYMVYGKLAWNTPDQNEIEYW